MPNAYNGTFSFDLRAATNGLPIAYGVRVALVINGTPIINESSVPLGTWTNYSFVLNETMGWRAAAGLGQDYNAGNPMLTQNEMQSVLANLTDIYIATDYAEGKTSLGDVDQTDIDTVRLSTSNSVPEPATFALWSLGGLLGLSWTARRSLTRVIA